MAVLSYKCPNCGGELVFEPNTQKCECEYCLSDFSKEELEDLEVPQSNEKNGEDTEADNGVLVYHCPNCGAEIVAEETTVSTFCYYCHNPVVLSGRVSGKFLPDKIIPFSIDKKEAVEIFLKYIQSKKFIPKDFFDKQQIEMMSGVYFPYWMVDVDFGGRLLGEGRNFKVWQSGDIEYKETKIYRIEREGDIHLEDIIRNALKKVNSQLAEGVLPYDVSKVEKFHTGYLSGFQAEKRDIEKDELLEEVMEEAVEYGLKILRETQKKYDYMEEESCKITYGESNWDYIMFPVWVVTYKGRDGKTYHYSMNGQDGRICGSLPIDYKKVWSFGGIFSAVVFILGLIGGYLF